jgi:hypothetical protein
VHRGNPTRHGVHGVILLADAKAMQKKVSPVKADLQEDVKISQVLLDRTRKRRQSIGWIPQIQTWTP